MNNLSHKVAIASACIALSFVLGASEEVKAATIILRPTTSFGVIDYNVSGQGPDGVGNSYYSGVPLHVGSGSISLSGQWGPEERLFSTEDRAFYEFNIANLSLAPNTVIKSAFFNFQLNNITNGYKSHFIDIVGYVGNGTAEVSDANKGVFLNSVNISSLSAGDTLNFDVTAFVNQQASNGNPFAGFAMNISFVGGARLGGTDALGRSSLVIETADAAEPVPEPTTIFGSALALGVGGWLKRKKLSQQNKTTSH